MLPKTGQWISSNNNVRVTEPCQCINFFEAPILILLPHTHFTSDLFSSPALDTEVLRYLRPRRSTRIASQLRFQVGPLRLHIHLSDSLQSSTIMMKEDKRKRLEKDQRAKTITQPINVQRQSVPDEPLRSGHLTRSPYSVPAKPSCPWVSTLPSVSGASAQGSSVNINSTSLAGATLTLCLQSKRLRCPVTSSGGDFFEEKSWRGFLASLMRIYQSQYGSLSPLIKNTPKRSAFTSSEWMGPGLWADYK